MALFYTKNGEDSLFFLEIFKSVDKLSELAGRNAETQDKLFLTKRERMLYNKRNNKWVTVFKFVLYFPENIM